MRARILTSVNILSAAFPFGLWAGLAAFVGNPCCLLSQQPWAQVQFSSSSYSGQLNSATTTYGPMVAGPEGLNQGDSIAGPSDPWFPSSVGAAHRTTASWVQSEAEASATLRLTASASRTIYGGAYSAGITPVQLQASLQFTEPMTIDVQIQSLDIPWNGVGGGVVRGPGNLDGVVGTSNGQYRQVVQVQPGVPITVSLWGFGSAAVLGGPSGQFFASYTAEVRIILRRMTLHAFDGLSQKNGVWSYLDGWASATQSGISGPLVRLQQDGDSRRLIAADGAARLLVRFKAPASRSNWPVRFRVHHDGVELSGTPAHGLVAEPGQPFQAASQLTPQVSQDPQNGDAYWFLVYRAPDDFVRSTHRAADEAAASRSLTFYVEWQDPVTLRWSLAQDLACQLRRAPVALAHGLFSNPGPFVTGPFHSAIISDPRFDAIAIDYEDTHAVRLSENKHIVRQWVAAASMGGVELAKSKLRAELDIRYGEGFAFARVDWVGHSMGGLLPRIASQENDPALWRSVASYGLPPVRKLILVDSPQRGSPIAAPGSLVDDTVWGRQVLDWVGMKNAGALEDLALHSSYFDVSSPLALRALTDVRSHAIVGTGVEVWLRNYGDTLGEVLMNIPDWSTYSAGMMILWGALATEQWLYATDEWGNWIRHDIAVQEYSQRAGLPSAACTHLHDTGSLLQAPYTLHVRNLASYHYANEVRNLLQAAVDSPLFAELPAVTSTNTQRMLGSSGGVPPQGVDLGAIDWVSLPSQVMPSGTFTVEVQAPALASLQTVVIQSNGDQVQVLSAPPFVAQFEVPSDAIGNFAVQAFGFDGAGGYALAVEQLIPVLSSAAPTQLLVEPQAARFNIPLEGQRVAVRADFTDGITRRLNSRGLWPVFVSSNPAVVSVGPDGVMRAGCPGSATISITLGGLSQTISAVVAYSAIEPYGSGLRGSGGVQPMISTTGLATIGDEAFAFTVDQARGGSAGVLVLGSAPSRTPIFGGTLLVDLGQASLWLFFVTTSESDPVGRGSATIPMAVPPTPELVGLTAFAQAAVLDDGAAQGVAFSDGLAVTVLP